MNPTVFSSRLSRFSFLGIALFLGISTLPTTARASVLMTVTESGGNVNVIGSGTINLTALSFINTSGGSIGINGSIAALRLGTSGSIGRYSGFTGPSSFGTLAGFQSATSGTGDHFGVVGGFPPNRIEVPVGYASGGALSGSLLFSGATFASLGLTPGTYTWSWGSGASADSLTVQIGASAPEPGTLALLALGMVGGILARRRK